MHKFEIKKLQRTLKKAKFDILDDEAHYIANQIISQINVKNDKLEHGEEYITEIEIKNKKVEVCIFVEEDVVTDDFGNEISRTILYFEYIKIGEDIYEVK